MPSISVLIQQGNPSLRPLTQNHELNVTATLWDNLTLTSFVSYNANDIQEYYQPLQDRQSIGSSFANAKLFQSLSAISYTLPFSQFLMWSNTVRANYYKVKSRNMSRHEFSWGLTSKLTYFNPKWQAAFQLSYNSRFGTCSTLTRLFRNRSGFFGKLPYRNQPLIIVLAFSSFICHHFIWVCINIRNNKLILHFTRIAADWAFVLTTICSFCDCLGNYTRVKKLNQLSIPDNLR